MKIVVDSVLGYESPRLFIVKFDNIKSVDGDIIEVNVLNFWLEEAKVTDWWQDF